MRKSLFLYLFVFTALLAIFMYVSGSKMAAAKDHKITTLEAELQQAHNTSDSLYAEAASGSAFEYNSNEEAYTYFENRGFDPSEVARKVEDAIISRNKADADNELIPYEGMEGFFRINKVKLVNHKWALASFTDGTYWGDLFISYELDDQGNISLTSEKAVLYPRN
ncbi:MAG: hypothetical protein WBL27_02155 [Salinimicrobium sp.]